MRELAEVANPTLSRSRHKYLQGATWLARDLRPLPSRDPGGSEFYPSSTKSSSAAKLSPSQEHTTTTTREATIQAYTSPELPHFPGPLMSNFELPADMTVASRHAIVAWHEGSHRCLPLRMKSSKPMYTNGFGSGEQPTAQLPLNQVCKLQKRDASLSWCGMGVVQ
ncbi:hypothetical protein F5888DRAFT_1658816 [Russula emetica]|nr:hypothetical protein F5888DRAFT_1756889 [Russula emetica]KAF8489969.1 hypothetical protein F5888DRAFT_1743384 [Russula emetica]KAF8490261.1 hypothetical protein F5888DRAFT_1742274 [Russula emetica]KAF8494166.1 hypothetical protein F5888DRAFT_1719153 [Russula emetica]KAF8495467.1 hypothetical protein F5888DRAFT_1711070 [Russula emetica]